MPRLMRAVLSLGEGLAVYYKPKNVDLMRQSQGVCLFFSLWLDCLKKNTTNGLPNPATIFF